MHKGFGLWLAAFSLMSSMAAAQVDRGGHASARDTLYLDAAIDNRTPYVGQEVVLTYSLCFSGIAPRIADSGVAEHPGLWVHEVTPEGYIRSTPITEGGLSLRKALIKQLKLVPMQAGTLSVSNYRLHCYLPANRGIGSGNAKDNESVITAPTTTIVAKPLPKGEPQGFSGAVGDFSIVLASKRYQIHAGEPLNLAVRISGRGNLKTFPQVRLSMPEGFSQVNSEVQTVTQQDAGKPEEAISAKITLVTDHQGTFSFTPVRLTAFNPWKGRYETISSGEITVTVLPPRKASATAPADSRQMASASDRTVWIPPAVMIFMAGAILVLIALLFRKGMKKQKLPDAMTAQRPEPQPAPPHQPGLPESAESLRGSVYDALGKAGIRNPAGLTSEQLRLALAGKQVSHDCTEALLDVMKTIDQAVYTPGKTSFETIEKLNRKTATVLEQLRKQCAP